MIDLVVFDLDGTLAKSKSPLDPDMGALLGRLLAVVKVAVISGGAWPQFESQVLARLPGGARLSNLSILPTCGTKYYAFDGAWRLLYSEDFTPEQSSAIIKALTDVLAASGFTPKRHWGELIEDRGSQITLSALGQAAPLAEKTAWDPDFAKRKTMREQLQKLIPEFSIQLGGATSIDVTRPGIDKAYGLGKLRDTLGIPLAAMLFIGDAIFPGGNDYPAKQAGVRCVKVRDPDETGGVVEALLACLEPPEAGP
jgi:HAD superfamily hydrolase (TIGR01484 family)